MEALQEENARLQAELAAMRNDAKQQQQAQQTFINHAILFDQHIPPQEKSTSYNNAYVALVSTQDSYREAAEAGAGHIFPQTFQNEATRQEVLDALRTARHSFNPYMVDHPVLQGIPPQEQLIDALSDLENNFQTHSSMVVSYMEQRNRVLCENAREQVKDLLRPYFIEAADLRQLTSKVVALVETSLELDVTEVDTLSMEIRKPIAEVLLALMRVINRMPVTENGS